MFFVFVYFCRPFFRFKENKLYAKKGDPIYITFTGLKTSDCPISFDFDYKNLFRETKKQTKSFSTFGESIVGLRNQVTDFRTGFLRNFSSDTCFCGRTMKNIHKSNIRKLIRRNYMYTFKLDSFPLSSFYMRGLRVGYNDNLNTHFLFQVHYKNVDDDLYEITGLTGIAKSLFYVKTDDKKCLNSQKVFALTNFTELGFTHSIEFIESQIIRAKMPTFDAQLKQIKVLIACNVVFLILLIVYSSNGKGLNNNNDTIWEKLKGDVFRMPHKIVQVCCLSGAGFQVLFTVFIASLFTYTSFVDLVGRIFNILPFCGVFNGIFAMILIRFIGIYDWKNIYRASITALPSFYVLIYAAKVFLHFFNSSFILPSNRILLHIILLFIINHAMVLLGFYIGNIIYIRGPPVKINPEPRKMHRPPIYLRTNVMKVFGGLFVFVNIWKTIDFIYLSVVNEAPYESPLSATFYFFVLLIVVSAEAAILSVYLHARHENYNWWRTSCVVPANVYAIYLVYGCMKLHKYKIVNLVTLCFGILDHIAIAGALGVACGAIGFASAFLYLLYIYRQPTRDRI